MAARVVAKGLGRGGNSVLERPTFDQSQFDPSTHVLEDYGQATDDLRRLISICTKQIEGKTNQFGPSDKPTSFASDLRQARVWLSTVAEEARKDIPLNMFLIA